jgi:competence protein ComEC
MPRKDGWQRYIRAATTVTSSPAAPNQKETVPNRATAMSSASAPTSKWMARAGSRIRRAWDRLRHELEERTLRDARAGSPPTRIGVRIDLRLLPAVLAAWAAAWWGTRTGPGGAVYCSLGAVGLGILITAVGMRTARSALLLLALCLFCVSGVMMAAGVHGLERISGPVAQAIATSSTVSGVILVTGTPQQVGAGGDPYGTAEAGPSRATGRIVAEAILTEAAANGQRFQAATPILVLADSSWAEIKVGQYIATAGQLRAADPGQDVAAVLMARTEPRLIGVDEGWSQQAAILKADWRSACQWLWPDAAALLPGMVTGDRSAVPADLDIAMKRVGLTHLTAVSGANCTLILMGIVWLARCLRSPRWVAGAAGGLGLTVFVTVVGPDPSVLRAALMGLIGLVAMLSGRPKRLPALLAAAVVLLLVSDPWLSTDFGFVLSVLATVGLVVLGRRCSQWLGRWLPHWLAQAVAVPLAAQLFCAPVIVLLQPQLSLYAIPANVAAAPVVALVTGVGTLGLPALLLPWAVPALVAVSGCGAGWVGLMARFFSALPGAAIPWPDGLFGAVLMAVLSAGTILLLWAGVNRELVLATVVTVRAWLPDRLQLVAGLPGAAAAAVLAGGILGWILGTAGFL